MATLTAVKFPTATGADEALEILERLQREEAISVHDGAIVSWAAGAKKPKTRQLSNVAGAGALGGGFWGLLFGLIFFVPILGLFAGAAMGAMAGSMRDVGIDDDFIKEKVTPRTSALFALTSDGVPDKVAEAFHGFPAMFLGAVVAPRWRTCPASMPCPARRSGWAP
jgi:uncharacterized membrane protein